MKFLSWFLGIILFIVSVFGGGFFGYILTEVDKGEELNKLSTYVPTTPTKLFDVNGNLISELYKHKQEILKFQDIPPYVVNAFISVEDNNFYNHFGIDFSAILRAAITNLRHGKVVQGGSTLTQQLSKAILQNRKRNFARKFLEALLTLQIEQEYSKEEILEIYFNLIYLGHGTTGIASASSVYFSKDARELSIAEGAVLARLPKAPVKYSPFKNANIAKDAHKTVLRLMSENGFLPANKIQKIHDDFWVDYWSVVITQSPSSSTWGNKLDKAPHFTEHVRKQLLKTLGEELVYTGGLKVFTTLDLRKQQIAQEELKKSLDDHDRISYGVDRAYRAGVDYGLVSLYNMFGSIFPIAVPYVKRFDQDATFRVTMEKELIEAMDILSLTSPLENETSAITEFRKRTAVLSSNLHVEGAVITLDHTNGYIVTMVGGSEFTPKNQFNRAMSARRQTGSSFKPYVYGAAITERTIGSGTGIMDAPFISLGDDGGGWAPEDSSGEFHGMVPASRALALSMNIVSVQVYMKTGGDAVIDFASKVTKTNPKRFPYNPTLALGVAELTPYEMALGYSIIANKGKDIIPFTVRYVLNQSGNIIYNKEAEVQKILADKEKDGTIQIISPGSAYIMKRMLQMVASYGTPTGTLRDRCKYIGASGGKTGSTSSFTDSWYNGFDPKYTTAVWIGYDKSSISLGRGMTGAIVSTPVWGHMYRRFYEGSTYPEFPNEPVPDEVVRGGSCANNGMIPSSSCSTIGNMYLKPITISGVTKAYGGTRRCDGSRDHMKTVDFRDFIQKEYQISNDEIGKSGSFKTKVD